MAQNCFREWSIWQLSGQECKISEKKSLLKNYIIKTLPENISQINNSFYKHSRNQNIKQYDNAENIKQYDNAET